MEISDDEGLYSLLYAGIPGGYMNISLFSNQYIARRMNKEDITDIYLLCSKNSLYYQHCPPFVTKQSILDDMKALPPNKEMSDKYYIGYYKGEKLIAVMDLIMAYPDEKTAFIGFFMTAVLIQNMGIGSRIIDDLCSCLTDMGFSYVRLGWVKGNLQAEHFWHKNSFTETGITYDTDNYTVIVAQRVLLGRCDRPDGGHDRPAAFVKHLSHDEAEWSITRKI